MSSGESFGSVVGYDYGTYEYNKSDYNKAPRFNGDSKELSWWKTKMYSYIMGLDELFKMKDDETIEALYSRF